MKELLKENPPLTYIRGTLFPKNRRFSVESFPHLPEFFAMCYQNGELDSKPNPRNIDPSSIGTVFQIASAAQRNHP